MRCTVSLNNEIEVYTVVYWNRIVFTKSFPNIYCLQVELFSVKREKYRSSVLRVLYIYNKQFPARTCNTRLSWNKGNGSYALSSKLILMPNCERITTSGYSSYTCPSTKLTLNLKIRNWQSITFLSFCVVNKLTELMLNYIFRLLRF